MTQTKLLVRGDIMFESMPTDLSRAKLYIRLEDTSFADEEAEVIVESTLTNLPTLVTPQGRIPFSLSGPPPNPKRSYSLNVHVDVEGNGEVNSGDYINTESYPVLTFGHGDQITVKVHRV